VEKPSNAPIRTTLGFQVSQVQTQHPFLPLM
jgi:hypothetical protein